MSRKRSSDGDGGSSKRFKNDQPSRVVFLRNLPAMVTDAEINEVCARFGTLVNIMRLDAKNQAFVEFEQLDGAKALIRTYNGQFPIKGKIASALYSDRQYISFTRELDENPPNRILFVIITLQIHPVDCDTLYQVFSRIGKVRKVVLQTKAVQLQGFVEMETVSQAAEAKAQFNHKHIYACSCRLSIAFAKLQSLDCSDPNFTRDYTTSEPRSNAVPAPSSMALTTVTQDDQFSDRKSEDSGGCVLLVNGLDDKIKPEELFNLFGTCGDVMKVKILFNKRDSALLEFRNASQASTAREMMQGCPMSGRQLHIVPSSKDSINISRSDNQEADLSRDFTHCGSHRFRDDNSPQFQYIRPPCEILHVSNIPPSIDEEALMDAFAPFGARHAELFKKKTTMGTVVFKSTEAAVHALMAMNGWDWNTPGAKPMFLAFAKTSSGSGSGSSGSGLTFSSSSALPSSTALIPLQNRVLGLPTMLEPLRDPQMGMGQLVPSSVVYPVYESAMPQMQMMPMSSMQGLSLPTMQAMPQMQPMQMQQVQTLPVSQISQLSSMNQMAPMQSMPMGQVPQLAPVQTLPMAQVSQLQPNGQYQVGTLQTVQQLAPGTMQSMAQFPQTNLQPMATQFQVSQGMPQFIQGGSVQMVTTSMAPPQMSQLVSTMPQAHPMGQMGEMAFQQQDFSQRGGMTGYSSQLIRQQVPVSQMAMIGPPPGMM